MANITPKQALKAARDRGLVKTIDHPKLSNRRRAGPVSGSGQARQKLRTQAHIFDKTLQKTDKIIKEIADNFDWADQHKAYQALRSVLQVLRDRLPVYEAVAFGAQLPMLMRGFYYEGWKPSAAPIKMIKEEFLGEVEQAVNQPFDEPAEEIVKAVCAVLDKHLSPGEMNKLKKMLPKDIAKMIG